MSLRYGRSVRLPSARARSVTRNDVFIGTVVRRGHVWLAAWPDPHGTFLVAEDGCPQLYRTRDGATLALVMAAEGIEP